MAKSAQGHRGRQCQQSLHNTKTDEERRGEVGKGGKRILWYASALYPLLRLKRGGKGRFGGPSYLLDDTACAFGEKGKKKGVVLAILEWFPPLLSLLCTLRGGGGGKGGRRSARPAGLMKSCLSFRPMGEGGKEMANGEGRYLPSIAPQQRRKGGEKGEYVCVDTPHRSRRFSLWHPNKKRKRRGRGEADTAINAVRQCPEGRRKEGYNMRLTTHSSILGKGG